MNLLRRIVREARERADDVVHKLMPGSDHPRHLLLLSSTGNSNGLCFPFYHYRQELRERLGVSFNEKTTDDLDVKFRQLSEMQEGVAIVSMPLRWGGRLIPQQRAVDFFSRLAPNPKRKIVLLDSADHALGRHFDVMPFVDAYLMPFMFRDPANYRKEFLGANIFADFMSRQFGIEPTKENEYYFELFHSQVPAEHEHKMLPIWNWTLWPRLVKEMAGQGGRCLPHGTRAHDVHCRANPYSGWCKVHRMDVCERLSAMPGRRNIASTQKVPLATYYQELLDSKIAFSPFGWGEICPKDFEAVFKGCLLMKPSVEHLVTYPDFHVPNETYVPVKWDMSDLEEKVAYYCENEAERQRIVRTASERLERYYEQQAFVPRVEEILRKLGV